MKNRYRVSGRQWWLLVLWALGFGLPAGAQTTQPPVIQWQRVIEANSVSGPVSGRAKIITNSQGGYSVLTGDRRLLFLATSGNIVADTPLTSTLPTGETVLSSSTAGLASASDGGVVVGVQDNGAWSLQKRDANGSVVWVNRSIPYSRNEFVFVADVVASPDGGFVVFATRQDQNATPGQVYVIANKVDKNGNQVWSRIIKYPNASTTRVEQAIPTPDGGYLLAGSTYAPSDNNTFFRGWAAKLDEQANPIWQKRYDDINGLNGVAPYGAIDGTYLLNGPTSASPPGFFTPSSLVINGSGDLRSDIPGVVVPFAAFNSSASITAVPVANRPLVYAVANDTPLNENGGDIRLTGVAAQGSVVWTKTLGGSGRDYTFRPSVVATDNGFVIAGITESTNGDVQGKATTNPATWIVKLQDPANALTLTQPTYNCQTGAITFNTSGGDGSPVTYTAPGISRANATDNFGTVEQGLRGDPKPITITATQSGYMTSYTFDLKAACDTGTPSALPSPILATIPDRTFTVDSIISYPEFVIGGNGYNPAVSDDYKAWSITASGLPPGLTLTSGVLMSTFFVVSIDGRPNTVGVYPVTVTATNTRLPGSTPFVTRFTITITPVNPPTGGSLTLTQPTYNCQTGAIIFNTSGGDGSPVTYTAPGISRVNVTDNFGTVEQGLRGDPKPITVTATQSGQTVSYVFDFGAFCSGNPQPPVGTPTILPPVVNGPIPAMTRRADSGRPTVPFVISDYFRDPTPAHAGYRSNLRFSVDESAPGFFAKLPLGYFLKDLSAVEAPYAIIAGSTTFGGSYTVTVTATNLNLPPPNNSVSTTLSVQIIGMPESNPDDDLRLTAPLYNCQTGVITFRALPRSFMTAPVTYAAPGVILESPTSTTGIVEPGLRANPGPIIITATQNGEIARYTFDLKAYLSAYCGYVPTQPPVNPPTGGNLTLLAPAYDCSSGALTFRTSGGNGLPIEYQAAGITGWTTNPNQFVDRDSRTANDVKPFMLMARQNGQVVTYTWDLKAACGRARIGAPEPESKPTLLVLGNPVVDQLRVVVRGAAGKPLRLQLTDMRGRLVENRTVEPTAGETEQIFDISQQAPGLLLLWVTTDKHVLMTKVLKR